MLVGDEWLGAALDGGRWSVKLPPDLMTVRWFEFG